MYHVYVIRSKSRKYLYIGLSNDLVRRFAQHQEGKSQTTRAYRPFELVYSERFISRLAARKREKYLKSGIGKEWVRRNFSDRV